MDDAREATNLVLALVLGIAELARKVAGQQMQRGREQPEQRIAARPCQKVVEAPVGFLEQHRFHLLLEIGEAACQRHQIRRRCAPGSVRGRPRGQRLAQLDQRAQVGADEVQYERKRTREIANLRPRDHRPAASTGLQVEHALQFQKTQRLTQCGAGDFVPREHVVLRRQPVADLACVGLDVVHDRLRHAKRALAPCERERLALLIHVRHQ